MSIIGRVAFAFSVLCLCGCPRGETKSLGEVYEIAKQRFVSVKDAAVPEDVSQPLKDIDSHLNQIAAEEGTKAAQSAGQLAALLTPLTTRAGYPTRPAMGEIVAQYRMMAEGNDVKNPTARLLAARTYSLLASELETTRFSVQ